VIELPPDATIIPLTLALFVSAGAVHGTAFALARSGSDLFYLVDDAVAAGPPVWVHEGEIERSNVMPAPSRTD
jgi:hypothetical protein